MVGRRSLHTLVCYCPFCLATLLEMARSFTLRNAISLLAAGFLACAPVSEASSLHHHLHHQHLFTRHHARTSHLEAHSSILETRTADIEGRDNNIRKRAIPTYQGYSLTWSDDFTGSGQPSSTNWRFSTGTKYQGGPDNWGTGEIETYTSSTNNVYVDGSGLLHIVPRKDSSNRWTSARIETNRVFRCATGGKMIIEARIKLPSTPSNQQQGIWPAFWAMGNAFRSNPMGWPGTGELDVMEQVNGDSEVFQSVHCGYYGGGPCNEPNGLGTRVPIDKSQYHTYTMTIDLSNSDWRSQSIEWRIDNAQTNILRGSQLQPSQQQGVTPQGAWESITAKDFFILLNVAVGGSLPNAIAGTYTPNSQTRDGSNSEMIVDYVAVYNAPAPTNTPPPSNPTATPSPIQPGQTKFCVGWRKVQSGETCKNVVDKFQNIGLTTRYLVEWNPALGSESNCRTTPGYYVCVKTQPQPVQPGQLSNCGGWRYIQPSDTCSNVVSRYTGINLTLSKLVQWNPALGTTSNCHVSTGYYVCVKMMVPQPAQAGQIEGCTGWRYTSSSDTCSSLASKYRLSLSTLVRWNPALGSTSNCRVSPKNFVCVAV